MNSCLMFRSPIAMSVLAGSLGFASSGRAADPARALSDHLNAVHDVLVAKDAGERKTACDALKRSVAGLRALPGRERARLKGAERAADSALRDYCGPEGRGYFLDGSAEIPSALWQSAPLCATGDRRVRVCRYSHSAGRGLFIYRQDSVAAFSNFLVCALSANSTGGPLSSGYSITSRCTLSNLSWDAYLPLYPRSREIRPDVLGVLRWPDLDAAGTPIELPAALSTQCELAFSNALFCTPTLMVLPVDAGRTVDVCSLRTKRSTVRLPFIRISSGSSRWECGRVDLAARIDFRPHSSLPYKEQRCVAAPNGRVNSSCDYPYVPRTQKDVRVLTRAD